MHTIKSESTTLCKSTSNTINDYVLSYKRKQASERASERTSNWVLIRMYAHDPINCFVLFVLDIYSLYFTVLYCAQLGTLYWILRTHSSVPQKFVAFPCITLCVSRFTLRHLFDHFLDLNSQFKTCTGFKPDSKNRSIGNGNGNVVKYQTIANILISYK